MRIFLVRHGESQANVNKSLHSHLPDHEIALSSRGKKQAFTVGEEIVRYFDDVFDYEKKQRIEIKIPKVRVWNSPYRRTRETAQEINKAFSKRDNWDVDYKEHLLLHEQKFGLFDGISDDELLIKYPTEYAFYKKHEDFQGKFWAPMPLGESRSDVAQRVHQSFGTFIRDNEKHGINNLVIVSHGTTIRAFIMMWMHFDFEWMEREKNPSNCSVLLIEDGKYKGYIFDGFK